ncbi:MAG: hypothetical protein M3133_08650 [Actinomycetota bacterium]|nr:hypothetical protein [Actinomycetota bacterium]
MSKKSGPASELRAMVDQLPLETRRAMLDGMDADRIITGRYADRWGGLCPMFAAHRRKGLKEGMARVKSHWSAFLHMQGRPRAEVNFAWAWDRYARGRAGKGPRSATESELLALRTMLQASIDSDTARGGQPLAEARRAEAEAPAPALRGDRPPRQDTGDRDRTPELSGAEGWAWLRSYRRYDEYEDAMRRLEENERRRAARPGTEPEGRSEEEIEYRTPVAP